MRVRITWLSGSCSWLPLPNIRRKNLMAYPKPRKLHLWTLHAFPKIPLWSVAKRAIHSSRPFMHVPYTLWVWSNVYQVVKTISEHFNTEKVVSNCVSAQPCPNLSDYSDCSPSASSAQEVFQARILEWVSVIFTPGIFPIQGLNLHLLCLLDLQVDSLPLHHLGSPNIK